MSHTVLDSGRVALGESIHLKPLQKDQGERSPYREVGLEVETIGISSAPAISTSREASSINQTRTTSPATVRDVDGSSRNMSKEMIWKERMYFAAACVALFIAGWNE